MAVETPDTTRSPPWGTLLQLVEECPRQLFQYALLAGWTDATFVCATKLVDALHLGQPCTESSQLLLIPVVPP